MIRYKTDLQLGIYDPSSEVSIPGAGLEMCFFLALLVIVIVFIFVQGGKVQRGQPYVRHQPKKQSPTVFDKCVDSLTSTANHLTLKMQETGPTVNSSYPRRLPRLTTCRYNYKGSTFSSVILEP